jgi:hypothetical protein
MGSLINISHSFKSIIYSHAFGSACFSVNFFIVLRIKKKVAYITFADLYECQRFQMPAAPKKKT